MEEWKKIKIGEFLFERKGKYKPDDEIITGLKRIHKIDFSGNFHIVQKPSKTNMILINPNDFVISGIGIHNGSMGVYNGKENVVATIHYSSYTFDTEKISVEYFKRFLKSTEFIDLINPLVRGGMRPEIKAKHLLPLEINLPNLEKQKEIVAYFKSIETEDRELKQELTHQQSLLKKLRQQILQEAIEGKLSQDWRAKNPNAEPAGKLLKRIQAEKQQLIKDKKIKNQKPLPAISEAEKPFELPEGWAWCRLGKITNIVRGGSPRPAGDLRYYQGNIPFLKVANLTASTEIYLNKHTYTIKEAGLHKTRKVPKNTLMLTNSGATLGIPKICGFETTFNDGIAAFIHMNEELYKPYFYYVLLSKTRWFLDEVSRGQGQPNLNTDIIGETVIFLPPARRTKSHRCQS